VCVCVCVCVCVSVTKCPKPGKSGSVRCGGLKQVSWKQFSELTLIFDTFPQCLFARARTISYPVTNHRIQSDRTHVTPRALTLTRDQPQWQSVIQEREASCRSGISPEHTMTRIPSQRGFLSLLMKSWALKAKPRPFCPFQTWRPQ